MSKSKVETLELKIGRKPVKPYITAVIFYIKTGGTDLVIKARGKNVSKAVDVAEILKRFQETPMELMDIKIGTEEFKVDADRRGALYKPEMRPTRRVSFIEISMKLKK